MKEINNDQVLAGVWGLNISSYLMSSLPYLQAISLVLAITVSIVTLVKLSRDGKLKRKQKP